MSTYEHQLGLVPEDEEAEAVRYPCADGTAVGVYLSPENAGKSPATLAGWFVNDIDQTMAELASRGVVFRAVRPARASDRRAGRLRCRTVQGRLDQGP